MSCMSELKFSSHIYKHRWCNYNRCRPQKPINPAKWLAVVEIKQRF